MQYINKIIPTRNKNFALPLKHNSKNKLQQNISLKKISELSVAQSLFVYTNFHAYIHLRFKHTVLGTQVLKEKSEMTPALGWCRYRDVYLW